MPAPINDILSCPLCHGHVNVNNKLLIVCSKCGSVLGKKIGNIYSFADSLSQDLILSSEKWDDFYKGQNTEKKYKAEHRYYKKYYLKDVLNVFPFDLHDQKNHIYLEIGCGNFFLGQELAPLYKQIVGIDLSLSALQIAEKMLIDRKIKNFILIQGNILHLPIRNKSIDVIYGGGVIEHFKDTQGSVQEMYRVLKPRGLAINTVPYLNLASLTYRQLWGNIPNVPVLKQIAEFIHIKILKGTHMIFGYEMSFLASTLIKIHRAVGFKKVAVDRFKIALQFSFLPKQIRPMFIWLAENSRLFWPMVKVVATK
ncbi:MAG: Methyltransferase type 11 [Microgenomates group bacterium GW2011_GWC1_44_37]|uniref:Methyltransferase type 11 n=1 Tax=Candidatus Collierbacteria bacterium GW2011_GWB2_44_22 TaxID=1618387 RepID=A0A0G1KX18_9BACT|nr:MAG: Methyltransferase type 11 [Candidatus Collierbacteria bacterium GW2011_GWA2_44_13]KKT51472.1 MAG: Methyltransferase type 11 [Candidatus Collierbacteria bacterium GW2011_GWB1_44_197]KKT52484.1 MAG: Methyltransferase type 11 [Candidatus Collierbacteria bacterium GW2011_GWB2_44_22]KKT62707.1 MAG: Methyltransferase type 11 [Candidatus Collierbacteria bacterium GW2011_GWD1_44_27]KKT66485.1 MAG: Methyltransferase type 11 [Candidatus Collierbacteria bacterium GW2011_GWC2_44_30]KKT69187.1 MAG: